MTSENIYCGEILPFILFQGKAYYSFTVLFFLMVLNSNKHSAQREFFKSDLNDLYFSTENVLFCLNLNFKDNKKNKRRFKKLYFIKILARLLKIFGSRISYS